MGHSPLVIDLKGFDRLLDELRSEGYRLVGPTIRDGTMVYSDLTGSADLPAGWTDRQDAGTFRLAQRSDPALFGYVPGADSWKKFLHPPRRRVWQAERTSEGIRLRQAPAASDRLAFIGARSCELHAVAAQDRVFLGGSFSDADYAARRRDIFVVAVNCGHAGGTCFCTSMNTGPRVVQGFDLALTEMIEADRHRFVVEIGTERGAGVMARIPHEPALASDVAEAGRIIDRTAASMGRTMDGGDVKALLYRNVEHARWDDVAARCLSCANCTMVCPTCFCSNVEDMTDLTGEHAERWQRWDSCFTQDFSYIHGGSVRSSTRSRYRQWMTHKLATWFDQFGTSGCVGCGRCITWCPVGIDITEEVRAIRESDVAAEDHQGRASEATRATRAERGEGPPRAPACALRASARSRRSASRAKAEASKGGPGDEVPRWNNGESRTHSGGASVPEGTR